MSTTIQTHNRPELSPQWRLMLRLRDELQGKRCICLRSKAAGRPFCPHCIGLLTDDLRNGLDKKFQAGYEEAYQAAVDFLAAQKRKGVKA